MRRFLAFLLTLLVAACATAPRPTEPAPPLPPQSEHIGGGILGLTADEVVRRFGTPALQIREGDSLKLQFRNNQCVLDAYLYRTGTAPHRVTHVDTRNRAMAQVDQALCIASLRAP